MGYCPSLLCGCLTQTCTHILYTRIQILHIPLLVAGVALAAVLSLSPYQEINLDISKT